MFFHSYILGLCFHNLGVIVSSLVFLAAGLIRRCPFIHECFLKNLPNVPSDFLEVEHQAVPGGPTRMNNLPPSFSFLFESVRQKRNRVHGSPWPTDKIQEGCIRSRIFHVMDISRSKVVSKKKLWANAAKFLGRSVLVDGEGQISKTQWNQKVEGSVRPRGISKPVDGLWYVDREQESVR